VARAYASTVIDRDVDSVWKLVRTFDAVGRWIPGAKSCVTVEAGHGAAPIRRIVLADDTIIDEVLITLDDARRRIRYGFASPLPRGMRSFLGTAHVRPITNGDRTFIEWISEFDCDDAHEAKLVANIGATLAQLLAAVTAETGQMERAR
jgi:hypothetical protein